MTEPLNATIIHGSGGNPDGNWFPWLAAELRKRNIPVIVPAFPQPEDQSLSSWIKRFESKAPTPGPGSVLIGHSTGVALILNVLKTLTAPIAATFLVGGFFGKIGSDVYDPLNDSFFEGSFDWPDIRAKAGELFIYAGDDDPYVPLSKSIELTSLLASELLVIPGGRHLNSESDFIRFDRLLKDFDRWRASQSKVFFS